MIKKILISIAVLLAFPLLASATIMAPTGVNFGDEVAAAYYDAYIQYDSADIPPYNDGIVATLTWANDPGFKIAWLIVPPANVGDDWTYTYIVTARRDELGLNQNLNQGLSHWILQTSEDIVFDDAFSNFSYTVNDTVSATPGVFFGTHLKTSGNPLMPADSLFGIKFQDFKDAADNDLDVRKLSMTFNSTQNPVWYNFYAKDGAGGGVSAWNTGFDPSVASNYKRYIAAPDTEGINGEEVIPEPGTLMLLGAGLTGLFGYGKLKLRRKKK